MQCGRLDDANDPLAVTMSPTTSIALIATCGTTHPDRTRMLPDLVSDRHYPLRLNPRRYSVPRVSEKWPLTGARLVEPRVTQIMGLCASELAAACYPDAVRLQLRSDRFIDRKQSHLALLYPDDPLFLAV